ncbi:Protein ABCI12, chloroplastic [Tetrabaena socialis]|uniref:Protein ABCI12, chloroplastic n=1 Tax=Tetrabaena socialis TaxID=47790 RepID=A0A2J7ZS37_9CHLO|nr:Protein ABCI12, chloroplastic [Tetrabaena socialis]|eukprot:PNH03087.1 Protein ABCI12, chloroplastic [Tetrabaena socialis]
MVRSLATLHEPNSQPCCSSPVQRCGRARHASSLLIRRPCSRSLVARARAEPAAAAAGSPGGKPAGPKPKTPLQQQILNGILSVSNVPYSSFVPSPVTFLHTVDARIKQVWLVALYIMIARASPAIRLSISATVAAITMANFPPRLWQSQLRRLALLCGLIFLSTLLLADGLPSLLQARAPPLSLEGLPPIPGTGYHYVLLHVGIFTVTHRSLNLAITAASLTFSALQTASLCLVTTPGEEMAVALRWWLAPLRLIRVPVDEVAMTLLLSLRFMSLVFEEVRNLSLGLAARGINWEAQGGGGSLNMAGRLCVRLFGNLFQRSENIAQAMVVRGFQGPARHSLYMMKVNPTSALANAGALLLLATYAALIYFFK